MKEEAEEAIEGIEVATKVAEVEEKAVEEEAEVGPSMLLSKITETLKHLAPLHPRTSSSAMSLRKENVEEVDDKNVEEAEEEVEEEKIPAIMMEMSGLK